MGIAKVSLGSNAIIDLSNDTVTAESLHAGVTAHDAGGDIIVGTSIGPAVVTKSIESGKNVVSIDNINYN